MRSTTLVCVSTLPKLNALVTRVVFDEHNRATGVEYLTGERLYRDYG